MLYSLPSMRWGSRCHYLTFRRSLSLSLSLYTAVWHLQRELFNCHLNDSICQNTGIQLIWFFLFISKQEILFEHISFQAWNIFYHSKCSKLVHLIIWLFEWIWLKIYRFAHDNFVACICVLQITVTHPHKEYFHKTRFMLKSITRKLLSSFNQNFVVCVTVETHSIKYKFSSRPNWMTEKSPHLDGKIPLAKTNNFPHFYCTSPKNERIIQ